jgi:hypothetical protein
MVDKAKAEIVKHQKVNIETREKNTNTRLQIPHNNVRDHPTNFEINFLLLMADCCDKKLDTAVYYIKVAQQ